MALARQNTQHRSYIDQVNIKVDGSLIPESMVNNLIEVVVDTTLYLPAMFMMRFHDDELSAVDGNTFKAGASVEIQLSERDGDKKRVIVGEITAIEPEFMEDLSVALTIRGYDRSHRLNRGTKTKVFVQMSDSDIVQQIGSGAGLQMDVESTSQAHEHVFQHNQTDLEFLHQRAQRNGYELFVDDRKLYFRKPRGDRGEVEMEWGGKLLQFYPRLTLANQVDEVIVKGWDPVKKDTITGKATSSQVHPSVNLGGDGGKVAKQAFSSAKQMVVRQPVDSQGEADALAQAILDDINSNFVEAEGVAEGNPDILAGKKIKIENLGSRFSGTYVVTSAQHIYAPGRYEVQFRVEGARPKLIADLVQGNTTANDRDDSWSGVVPAIVTNNNDERNLYRVKVKFPWMDDGMESDWMRVVGIGSGDDRGLFWLPEVNDEVLVAFEHAYFDQPYVIGSLWNGKDKPPETTSNAVKSGKMEVRTLKTREGHTIRLTDDSSSKKIEIIDSDGKNEITLDTKQNKLIIKTKGEVNIESDGAMKLQAKGQLDIKGNANVNVQASGQLVLKGATVNIN